MELLFGSFSRFDDLDAEDIRHCCNELIYISTKEAHFNGHQEDGFIDALNKIIEEVGGMTLVKRGYH